jgi:hypothetical protein
MIGCVAPKPYGSCIRIVHFTEKITYNFLLISLFASGIVLVCTTGIFLEKKL